MATNIQQMIIMYPKEVTVEPGQQHVRIITTLQNRSKFQIMATSRKHPNPELINLVVIDPSTTETMDIPVDVNSLPNGKVVVNFDVWNEAQTKFTKEITIKKKVVEEQPTSSASAPSSSYDARDCPICLDRYNESEKAPRTLTCGHTHCHYCLEQLWKGTKPNSTIRCSVCQQKLNRKQVKTPHDLPKTFAILELIEQAEKNVEPPAKKQKLVEPKRSGVICANENCCADSNLLCTTCRKPFCQHCSDRFHLKTTNHLTLPIDDFSIELPKCARHRDEDAEFVCTDPICKNKNIKEFCSDCLMSDHSDHSYDFLSHKLILLKQDAQPIMKKITGRLGNLNGLVDNRKRSLRALDKNGSDIKMRRDKIVEIYQKNMEKDLEAFDKFIKEASNECKNALKELAKDKITHEKAVEDLELATSTSNLGLVQDSVGNAIDVLDKELTCDNMVTVSCFELQSGERI